MEIALARAKFRSVLFFQHCPTVENRFGKQREQMEIFKIAKALIRDLGNKVNHPNVKFHHLYLKF